MKPHGVDFRLIARRRKASIEKTESKIIGPTTTIYKPDVGYLRRDGKEFINLYIDHEMISFTIPALKSLIKQAEKLLGKEL